MKKEELIRVGIPLLSLGWVIGVFFMGWKTILWTAIGVAIGLIVKQLRENV